MTPTPPAQPAPFVPGFRKLFVINGQTFQLTPLNEQYFADERSALYVAEKFGDGMIVKTDFMPSNGSYAMYSPTGEDTRIFNIRYTAPYPGHGDPIEPVLVNAGILCGYYVRNPESEFPGLAEKLINSTLQSEYGVS